MKPTRLFPASALLAIVLCCAAACDDDDPFGTSPEAQADRIRANTPTELPPVTTEGAMTMGAYVETDTGRVLFVASGVERVDPIGSSSTDCPAFQNWRYQSFRSVEVDARWCSRLEIGDARSQSLAFSLSDEGYATLLYDITEKPFYAERYDFRSDTLRPPDYEILRDDRDGRILSATFSATLYAEEPGGGGVHGDTIRVTDGRLDVRYGVTP